jgi:mercuric ion transport protein
MIRNPPDRTATKPPEIRREVLKTTLAAGGLLAAFGAASCCALPLALASLGIGSTAFLGLALVFGPYQRLLLIAAGVCIVLAIGLMWRQRRARACMGSAARSNPTLAHIANGTTLVALVLLALTLWLAPPV